MEKFEVLAEYLKTEHSGQSNAVTAKELANSYGSAREIRRLVRIARMAGIPICSTNEGYFYPVNDFETNICKNRLRSMRLNLQKVIVAL